MDPRDRSGNPVRQTDEYGNPVQHSGTMGSHGTQAAGGYGGNPAGKTDEYGNPVQQSGTMPMGSYGTQAAEHGATRAPGAGLGAGYEPGSDYQHQQEHRGGGLSGTLHRSGSSSSSEDDGQGGRRKKGMKEKIKEKLGAGSKTSDTTTPTQGVYGQPKEKLGGGSKTSDTTTPTQGVYGQPHHPQDTTEKKGLMDKIKDKLPGAHTNN